MLIDDLQFGRFDSPLVVVLKRGVGRAMGGAIDRAILRQAFGQKTN